MYTDKNRLTDLLRRDGYEIEELSDEIYNVYKGGKYLYTLTVTETP